MSLLVFLVACGTGAAVALAFKPRYLVGRLAGIGGLLGAFGSALFIGSGTSVTIGEVTLVGSDYTGLFLACAAGSGLLLSVVALVSGWPDEIAPAALACFAGLAVALTSSDPGLAFAAGAAAAATGAMVIIRVAPMSTDLDGRLAEIRTIGVVVAGLLFAGIAVMRPPWAGPGDGPVLILAFAGLAFALAARSGAVPFHIPAAHLGQTATRFAPALLLVWIPAGLGLLAVSWSAATFRAGGDMLNWTVGAVEAMAVATLVLGGLAALVHDELDEIVAYSIVADAGFVLLAFAARTDAAAEPARLWLLVFVAAKTSLVAWAAAVSRAFGTANVPNLRGWLRRTPVLGLALVVIVVATLGWPGGAVYEARATLIRLALPSQLQLLFIASIVLSVAYAGRLLALGLLSPSAVVAAARSERPRWPAGAPKPKEPDPTAATAATAATAIVDGGLPTSTTIVAAVTGPSEQSAVNLPEPAIAAQTVIDATDAAAVPGEAPTARPAVRERRVGLAVRLNRTLEVSLVVVASTAVAAALAFGGLGASRASNSGIPLDGPAHATPTRPPLPTPGGPTPTPIPTPAPFPSGGASGSPGLNGSPNPNSSPSPIKTAGPKQGDTG